MRYCLTLAILINGCHQKFKNNKCQRACGGKGTLPTRVGRYPFWWEYKLVQPLQRTVWKFLKKLKTELPYDPAIPLLGIYLEKTLIQKDICTPMFTAIVFTTARTWERPKCPSTEKRRKKMWLICEPHIMFQCETLLCHQKEHNQVICRDGDGLESVIQSDVSRKKENTYCTLTHICGI